MCEKKDLWLIDVNRAVSLKVVFDEPVTADEALERFNNDEYADIIDEEVVFSETVGVSDDFKVSYYKGDE